MGDEREPGITMAAPISPAPCIAGSSPKTATYSTTTGASFLFSSLLLFSFPFLLHRHARATAGAALPVERGANLWWRTWLEMDSFVSLFGNRFAHAFGSPSRMSITDSDMLLIVTSNGAVTSVQYSLWRMHGVLQPNWSAGTAQPRLFTDDVIQMYTTFLFSGVWTDSAAFIESDRYGRFLTASDAAYLNARKVWPPLLRLHTPADQ